MNFFFRHQFTVSSSSTTLLRKVTFNPLLVDLQVVRQLTKEIAQSTENLEEVKSQLEKSRNDWSLIENRATE
jgi:hypothetical protein